jgi:hypothetical protein
MRTKKMLIPAAVLAILLGSAACHGPTTPGAGDMTGLWLLPFGGGTVASLTQSGSSVSGFAHVIDSPTTCWSSSDRLETHGTIGQGGAVKLTIGSVFPIEMTGVLSADGEVLNNVHSISRSCDPEGYPWEETASQPGVRIESLTGTYEFRFESGGVVRSFTANLTHTLTIGPNGEMPVTISATLGSGWPCAPRAVSCRDFFLMGYRLRGTLSVTTVPDFMFVETSPASLQFDRFEGTYSGSWDPRSLECIEGFTSGNVTITKR